MKGTNIEFIMNMTKSYLDGEIDSISYNLDFPYEVEKRYRKMVKEDREYAELIYDCLITDGNDLYNTLSVNEFRKLIRKQYRYIESAAKDEFY